MSPSRYQRLLSLTGHNRLCQNSNAACKGFSCSLRILEDIIDGAVLTFVLVEKRFCYTTINEVTFVASKNYVYEGG